MDIGQTTAPPGIDPKLAQCIHKAQAEVESALKGSTNTFHGYKYASADEVVLVARDALTAAGLAWIVIEQSIELMDQGGPEDRGSASWAGGAVGFLRATYAMVCIDNGAMHCFKTEVPIIPEPGKSSGWSRPLDKAVFGARTEANGYALRDALLIPREDAPDVSGRRDGSSRREDNGGGRRTPEVAPFNVGSAIEDIRKAHDLSKLAGIIQSAKFNGKNMPPEDVAQLTAAFTDRAVEVVDGFKLPVDVQKGHALLQRFRPPNEEQAARIDAALLRAKERTGRAS